jgi:hypothetical protein
VLGERARREPPTFEFAIKEAGEHGHEPFSGAARDRS